MRAHPRRGERRRETTRDCARLAERGDKAGAPRLAHTVHRGCRAGNLGHQRRTIAEARDRGRVGVQRRADFGAHLGAGGAIGRLTRRWRVVRRRAPRRRQPARRVCARSHHAHHPIAAGAIGGRQTAEHLAPGSTGGVGDGQNMRELLLAARQHVRARRQPRRRRSFGGFADTEVPQHGNQPAKEGIARAGGIQSVIRNTRRRRR